MLTNQEALDFVQEMLNAREPNVVNYPPPKGSGFPQIKIEGVFYEEEEDE